MADYTTIDDPTIYFDTKIYTGTQSNNITLTMDNVGWVWMKNRTNSGNHILIDVVRGGNNSNSQKPVLLSNTGGAEQGSDITATGGVAFGSTSTVIGSDNGGYNYNNSTSSSYVAWHWGTGTSFSNSAGANGADLASAGSYNRDSGFSIVTWTGNATDDQQIYHGLNAVPQMMILKNRTNSNNESWKVYHQAIGNTHSLTLDTTAAKNDNVEWWSDETPTSTVFTVGRQDATNNNSMIAYCFAEKQGYSKFGIYTGNGNVDGPFVYTGFKPAWLLRKRTDSTGSTWLIHDSKRGVNTNAVRLRADLNNAEDSGNEVDLLSNGFKIRETGGYGNASGSPYIYMAFAEQPFVTSTGVPATAR